MQNKGDKECISASSSQSRTSSDSNWEYQERLDEIPPKALTSFHHLAGFEFFSFKTEHL